MDLSRQQLKLEKQFLKIWRRSAIPVLQKENVADCALLLEQAQAYLPNIAADLPDLSATPISLRPALVGSLNMIVLYKVLSKHGVPIEEAGRICTAIVEKEVDRTPVFVNRLMSWFMFTKFAFNQAKKEAARLKDAPANQFRMTIEGAPGLLRMNITQCAICWLTQRHDVSEFTPYICEVDRMLSEKLGWGLKRTQTIASGANHCDFVFVKGADTDVTM